MDDLFNFDFKVGGSRPWIQVRN